MIDFGPVRQSREYEWRLPLISVVFLTMTFFLITGAMTGSSAPVTVELPAGALDEIKPPEAVTVYVGADGFVYIHDQIIEARFAPFLLRSFFVKEGQRSVQIRADKNTSAETVIELMEQMRGIGVEEVVILTERKK